MHGRLKIRTSAEEAARKKKEEDKKLILYRAATQRILEKRKLDEYDDEIMELTAKLLTSNPGVNTMWNIRREFIIKLSEDSKNQELFDKELHFTETPLQANPKSYGAWHHRCWILENAPNPNWQKEVDLCTKYLQMDERNFHCWDYRRYVVQHAKVSTENEFKFCTEKIEKNFSNYSSWHYRSKLLPILYPHHVDKSRPINEEKLKEELELVLTAAFTDPNDSSAWFYQRWLLGYSAPDFDIAAFKLKHDFAMISFTKPISMNKHFTLTATIGSDYEFKDWIPLNSESELNEVWILPGDFNFIDKNNHKFDIILKNIYSGELYKLEIEKINRQWIGIKLPKFEYEFGAGVMDVLKEQLESCNQLLDLEPDSKWTMLTAALLMRAINRKDNHSKTLEYLKRLQNIDSMRKGYYEDLSNSLEKFPAMKHLGLLRLDRFEMNESDLFTKCGHITQLMRGDAMLLRCS